MVRTNSALLHCVRHAYCHKSMRTFRAEHQYYCLVLSHFVERFHTSTGRVVHLRYQKEVESETLCPLQFSCTRSLIEHSKQSINARRCKRTQLLHILRHPIRLIRQGRADRVYPNRTNAALLEVIGSRRKVLANKREHKGTLLYTTFLRRTMREERASNALENEAPDVKSSLHHTPYSGILGKD